MNKTTKILLVVGIILVVVAAGFFAFTKMNKPANNDSKPEVNGTTTAQNEEGKPEAQEEPVKGNLNITNVDELTALVDKLYEGVEVFPSVATMPLDLEALDADGLKYSTGLSSKDNIDFGVVSEPMIGSQPYSMVLIKVKDAAKANEVAKEMVENINPNKWICVSAEKIYATTSGDIVCLVMAADEMAKPVFENFKKEAGKVGQEYVETNARAMDESLPEVEVVNGPEGL